MILDSQRFYAARLTDVDILEFAAGLESVCSGLGRWYLDLDSEFQKDVLAGSKLFWEARRKQGDTSDGLSDSPVSSSASASPSPVTAVNETILRARRKAKGWSQKRLGVMVGLSQSYVNHIERGKVKCIDRIPLLTRNKLEELFGMSFNELLKNPLKPECMP